MKTMSTNKKRNLVIALLLLLSGVFIFYTPIETVQAQGADKRRAAKAAAKDKMAAAKAKAKAGAATKTAMLKMITIVKNPEQGCIGCHALPASLNGNRSTARELAQVARVLPNHPDEPTRGRENGCHTCHTGLNWHAPATNMDFNNKTDKQLCMMLSTPTASHPTISRHLKGDSLINWAISGSSRPEYGLKTGRTENRSRHNKRSQWHTLVDLWVNGTASQRSLADKCYFIR